jgi:RNA polymerase sigma-70 factor (ECF subfamily)
VDALGGEPAGYHLLPATRADLLRRLGRYGDAADAYRDALRLTGTDVERRFLTRRLAEVSPPPPLASTGTPAGRL